MMNENKPIFLMLIGIPGAGKTSYAQQLLDKDANFVKFSSDQIREELWGDESTQGDPAKVFALMQKRTVEALKSGRSVIYDATNVTRKGRKQIISVVKPISYVKAQVVWAPIETCIQRDSERKRSVGKEVINKMLHRFQFPYLDEGFDEVEIINTIDFFSKSGDEFDVPSYVTKKMLETNIPHDNPHHKLNIYEHCVEAKNYCELMDFPSHIATAALFHDIGKPYVKKFIDSKGNPSEEAHYYQHQCLSAYICCGFLMYEPYTIWLIQNHMEPYQNSKYYRKLPDRLKHDLDLLHEADVAAH